MLKSFENRYIMEYDELISTIEYSIHRTIEKYANHRDI